MEIWLAILGWKFPSKGSFANLNQTQAHRPHKKESHHGSRHRHPCSSALSSPAATHATTRNSTTATRPYGTRVTACDQIPSLSAAAATKTATSTKSAAEHGLQINSHRRQFVVSAYMFIIGILLFCEFAIRCGGNLCSINHQCFAHESLGNGGTILTRSVSQTHI